MKPILILGGPTASGKSGLALQLADYIAESDAAVNGCVIINADSMQVYREIPIITAQPDQEALEAQPHALYGFLSVREECSAGIWLKAATEAIQQAHLQNQLPIVVGGTGMYLRCLTEGIAAIPAIAQEVRKAARATLDEIGHSKFHILLKDRDPIMGERLSPADTQRMLRAWEVLEQTNQSIADWQQKGAESAFEPEQFTKLLLLPLRETLYAQCNQRFLTMLNHGALEEVDRLSEMELDSETTAMKALGIPELMAFKRGDYSFDEAIEKAQQHTRNYAKRQRTWFRNQFNADSIIEEVNERAIQTAGKMLLERIKGEGESGS